MFYSNLKIEMTPEEIEDLRSKIEAIPERIKFKTTPIGDISFEETPSLVKSKLLNETRLEKLRTPFLDFKKKYVYDYFAKIKIDKAASTLLIRVNLKTYTLMTFLFMSFLLGSMATIEIKNKEYDELLFSIFFFVLLCSLLFFEKKVFESYLLDHLGLKD